MLASMTRTLSRRGPGLTSGALARVRLIQPVRLATSNSRTTAAPTNQRINTPANAGTRASCNAFFSSSRTFHSHGPLHERPPVRWGDLIPRPPEPNGSKSGFLIGGRPSYRRFDQRQNGRVPIWQDKRFQIVGGVLAVGTGGYYVTHLEYVPVTNRRRFMDVSPAQEEVMAKQAYQQVMNEFGKSMLPPNHPVAQYVQRVARRIIQASGMQGLDWEVHVIQSDEKNAFVLPGGKVFVFTGILPIAANEDGLATVLGHEVAHQLARHSAEKLSFAKLVMLAGIVISAVLDPSYTTQQLIMHFGMMLPFSRKCETEADEIGLQLMAQACFDPRESPKMWARMHKTEKGQFRLAFLTTHPASQDRAKRLEEWMPQALDTWNKSDCAATNEYAAEFNRMRHAFW